MKNDSKNFELPQPEDVANLTLLLTGFVITCGKCGSDAVYVRNTIGHSSTSGSFGAISLACAICGQQKELYQAR